MLSCAPTCKRLWRGASDIVDWAPASGPAAEQGRELTLDQQQQQQQQGRDD